MIAKRNNKQQGRDNAKLKRIEEKCEQSGKEQASRWLAGAPVLNKYELQSGTVPTARVRGNNDATPPPSPDPIRRQRVVSHSATGVCTRDGLNLKAFTTKSRLR